MTVRDWFLLVLITAAGFCLRFWFFDAGLGLDSSVTVYVVESNTIGELFERLGSFDLNPPLYYLFLQQWVRLFGYSPEALTLSSILFGTLLIPLSYFLTRAVLLDGSTSTRDEDFALTWAPLTAALFACVAPSANFFSHEIRSYNLLACIIFSLWIAFVLALKKKSILNLLALAVLTALSLYTHYISIFIVTLLLVSALFIAIIGGPESASGARRGGASVLLGCLLYAPWLPIFLEHKSISFYWVDPTPLSDFFLVICSNLAATMPLPWIVGFLLSGVLWIWLVVWLILGLAKSVRGEGNFFDRSFFERKQWLLISVVNLVPAVLVVGYAMPFIQGYNRYMLSFSLFMWSLSAISVVRVHRKLVSLIVSRRVAKVLASSLIPLTLVAIVGLNCLEVSSLGRGGASGLSSFARDFVKGSFGESSTCAVLMAPDYDSITLDYYLTKVEKASLPGPFYGFPREGELRGDHVRPAPHRGYARAWRDEDSIRRCLEWVETLDASNIKTLLVVRDLAVLNSAKMPAGHRIGELLDSLDKSYARGEVHHYKTRGCSFDVIEYDLTGKRDTSAPSKTD